MMVTSQSSYSDSNAIRQPQQPLKGGMTEGEHARWIQKGYTAHEVKRDASAEEKRLRDEQNAADAALEAALIAEMRAQGVADQGAEDHDNDEGFLIIEGEDHIPLALERRMKHLILGLKGRPISLRQYAMLNAQAEAHANSETQAQAGEDDHEILMTDGGALSQHNPPTPRKAVSHRLKYNDKAKKQEEERKPLRKRDSGAVNKTLPVRGLNSNWNHVKSLAVFNHGKALPKARHENLPSSSRPTHLRHLTDEEYQEYLKEDKRERRG